jgi:hypothetical protein
VVALAETEGGEQRVVERLRFCQVGDAEIDVTERAMSPDDSVVYP